MWLVLHHEGDVAAEWAASGLAARGLTPMLRLTGTALASARWWSHRVGRDTGVRFVLADGQAVDSAQVRGGVNRLDWVAIPGRGHAVAADREFAEQEFSAFFMSWLACLPASVLGRPTARGLSSPWLTPPEWAVLAARCGLAVPAQRMTSRASAARPVPDAPPTEPAGTVQRCSVVVVDDVVVGAPPGGGVAGACRRLAAASGCRVLGVELVGTDGRWHMSAATARPDLRRGGAAALDALAAAVSPAKAAG